MGFAVCTINLNQLVESGTRKGRGIVLILSVPRAFFRLRKHLAKNLLKI